MIRKILSNVKEYKKYALLSPIFVVMEVAMDIAIPFLMGQIVDTGIYTSSKENIIHLGIYLFICVFIALVTGILSGSFATKSSAGLAKNLRHEMFEKIQSFAFEDIDSFSTGSLVTRLTTDVQNIQVAFQMSIRLAFRSPLMLIFSFIMSFSLHPKLALVFLTIFPILGIGIMFIIVKVFPIFNRVFRTMDRLNTVVSENLLGIRVVKSFVKEDHETRKFKTVSTSLYKNYVKAGKLTALSDPLMQASIYFVVLLLGWFGAKYIVVDHSLKTGQLLSLVTYAYQIQISLMMISMLIIQMTVARTSGVRIVEVLNRETSLDENLSGVTDIRDGSIEFKDVCFSYSKKADKLALKNINLKINPGDNVGIIGSTGSSKSTLVSLIPRLYDVFSGSVEVGGRDVRDYNLISLRDDVAVVLQKNQLFSGTVIENLRWGNENATLEEVIEAAKIAQADDFITQVPEGYDRRVERGGTNFSGGQKQRLCIARALLKKPKILVLDDSTSALDNTTERLIVNNLNEKLPDLTRITISQRIKSISDCDYIIVLDKGEINGIGTHEELIDSNDIYREIAISQDKEADFDEAE
ncbi:ATP-binding cassette, subfamily B [Anaerosphaera aminiphila DSM 21120]|uniref:ATP-binding cassette, subfamily B n=1 Tax=Anaerosphaera aminiphila DSM 21120 TaxID=1120995 RepID=A0A1M5SSF6_9FIRM|nr:ABC transporter ATP-binding protein [Anaerosphaera aminiphila]SHH41400.1 ATP-binding cassette, subfamily B [Anaerosphaera aminiphila DSM 21120]